jgi:Ubiquitin binding region
MDMASVLASFPPDVREEVLLTSDEALLATLPPAVLAEAQRLRERAMRNFRSPTTASAGRNFMFMRADTGATLGERRALSLQGELQVHGWWGGGGF